MNTSRYRASIPSNVLTALKKRYPNLEFWVDGDTIEVLGAKPGVTINVARGELRKLNTDTKFYKYFHNNIESSTSPAAQETTVTVERPPIVNTGSAWPFPGAAADSNMQRPSPLRPLVGQQLQGKRRKQSGGNPHKRRGRPTQRSRRFRIQNAALRPVRRPFKQVFDLKLTLGYFDKQFSIKELVPELLNVYEEIRITNLSIVLLTNDISVTSGLYTAILLDQDGYGTALKSTNTWFRRVSDMPGSIVHHATRGFRLSWRATEPDSRNYVKVIDTTDISKSIARLYVIGKESALNIEGVLLIRGHCLCRGQYYDAAKMTVDMMRQLRLKEIEEEEEGEGSQFSTILGPMNDDF